MIRMKQEVTFIMPHKSHALIFLLIILTVFLTTPALAGPIMYTDRAAFDAAAGEYTLITKDSPNYTVVYDPFVSPILSITYLDLITFYFDSGGFCCNPNHVNPGDAFTLGVAGLASGGHVLQSVLAFGFDVTAVSLGDPPLLNPTVSSSGFSASLIGLSFMGVVSDTPFTANVLAINTYDFSIDNLAIKTVPEPSSLLFLSLTLMSLMAWQWKRQGNAVA